MIGYFKDYTGNIPRFRKRAEGSIYLRNFTKQFYVFGCDRKKWAICK